MIRLILHSCYRLSYQKDEEEKGKKLQKCELSRLKRNEKLLLHGSLQKDFGIMEEEGSYKVIFNYLSK